MNTKLRQYRNAVFALVLFFAPVSVFAHQPRLVESPVVTIMDPEISKAYYGTLTGVPQVFRITSEAPFNLYINVLVPDISGQKTDVSAVVYKDGSTTPMITLSAQGFAWKEMWEPFGFDKYLQGPEYRKVAPPGEYEIRVSSLGNDSKYSLAVGEIEKFDFAETVNALTLVPKLKRDFFDESPIGFILSPMGFGYVIFLFALSFIFGLVYRSLLRRIARKRISSSPRTPAKNINTKDRLLRALIGVVLFLVAITTTWNPLLIFFAGFCFFEAIFSWCGLYAAVSKSTCPIE